MTSTSDAVSLSYVGAQRGNSFPEISFSKIHGVSTPPTWQPQIRVPHPLRLLQRMGYRAKRDRFHLTPAHLVWGALMFIVGRRQKWQDDPINPRPWEGKDHPGN
jgi:hypothetical protein